MRIYVNDIMQTIFMESNLIELGTYILLLCYRNKKYKIVKFLECNEQKLW